MDLRTGSSLWINRDGPRPAFAPLSANLDCDVAVVGAGLAGALAAHELAGAGLSCVVLDARQPGLGSTAASTALLLYELDVPLHELAERMGADHAGRCYRMGVEAIDAIERLAAGLPSRCGFARRTSLLLASRGEDVEGLKRELAARHGAGLEVEFLGHGDLERVYSFSAQAALRSEGAQVDGYRLAREVLGAAAARGVRVFGDTRATGISRRGNEMVLSTELGANVRAKRVVLAAGYEGRELRKVPGRLVSTFAVATEPIERFEGWPDRCMIWETARPYLYIRTTEDGRAIIGGGDESETDPDRRDRLVTGKCLELMRRFGAMFPGIAARPETAWAGFFIETEDGLPYVGEDPKTPGLYLALCYGANGTTFAAVAARVIRELVVEGGSADAELLAVDRGSIRRRAL